jgi:hypothetical protein
VGVTDGRKLRLVNQPRFRIDLSTVPLHQEFTIRVETHAYAYDRAAGTVSGRHAEFATAAHAWLRDPAIIGGAEVITSGLTPVDTPVPFIEPVVEPVEPAPCVPGPGPDPQAGVMEFSAASFTRSETGFSDVIVNRVGGTHGAVTATFTASDGTAVAGVDYTATRHSVFFADGDSEPRTVSVPIVPMTPTPSPTRP